MKRILCLALCVLAAVLFCACDEGKIESTSAPAETTAVSEPAATGTPKSGAGNNAGLMAFMEKFDDTPTVGEKKIYEDKNITVTVRGINYAVTAGPELHLIIDNHLDKDITVQAPFAVINDYMMTPELNISVPGGKTAGGNLSLSYVNLAYADITCIQDIGLALRVVETKSYNPLFTTDLISLKTSAADSDREEYDESGQLVYDGNDIKIIFKEPLGKYKTAKDSSPIYMDNGSALLLVYIYNGTDRSVAVQTGDVTVNGYDMTSVMNRTVLPGKKAADTVTFHKMDLDERGIDTIDSVKVSFEIKDAESWEEIDSTGLISVTLPSPDSGSETTEESGAAE